ncbi:TolC family outer membrane protein [Alteromonas sp. 1_MG-2023]|uniref:TolC family outer membrane protein n=1 Tax=Alteromonas sp. 1_MG-2023 TaxID=3062669 RepID=UPI0026E1E3AB|nr:TolC family outer membrane protein [Alteromonas sp. 1_MG-2023]MDO6568482.1 TolC family outer membrane protein [Alteromonas sp. 1_MG-2023]
MSNVSMKKILTVCLLGLVSLSLFAQEYSPGMGSASLEQYVSKAINSNPEVQASWRQLKIAMEDVDIAKSGYRPTVDVLATSAYTDRNYGLDQEYAGHTAEIRLTQLLYDGFFTSSEISRFKQAQVVRYYELLGEIEQKSLETTQAYLDVQLYRELLSLAENNLITHVDVFKQIEESVIAGVGRRADLEQVSGRLSLSESNVLTELSNLHDVTARFLRLVGEKPAANLTDVSLASAMPQSVEMDIQSVLLAAYETSPSFNATIYNIDAQRFAIDSARSRYQPQIDLTASYGAQTRDEAALNNTISEASVGVNFSYNIYNGGADRAAIRQALSQVDLAKDLRDKACVDMRQTIQIAHNDISNLTEQIPSLNAHRLSSDRVKSAYMDQFTIGERSLLDLLDSENEFYESSRAYIQATFTLENARARLLAASGVLIKALGVSREGVASVSELAEKELGYDPNHICPAVRTSLDDASNILKRDSDADGIIDIWDDCVNSTIGAKVDDFGCEAKAPDPQTMTMPANAADYTLDDADVITSFSIDISFASNSSKVSKEYASSLNKVIDALTSSDTTGVIIHGHASLDGDAAYNQRLSERRASAVAAMLIETAGVDSRRITSVGYGETRPIVNEESQSANEQNRRIEATLIQL